MVYPRCITGVYTRVVYPGLITVVVHPGGIPVYMPPFSPFVGVLHASLSPLSRFTVGQYSSMLSLPYF